MKGFDCRSTLPNGMESVGGMSLVHRPGCSFDASGKDSGKDQGKERTGDRDHFQNDKMRCTEPVVCDTRNE